MSDDALDLRGLKCPLPALLTRRALERSADGAELVVLADDPLAPIDIPHMCRDAGYEVVTMSREGSVASITVRKPSVSAWAAVGPSAD